MSFFAIWGHTLDLLAKQKLLNCVGLRSMGMGVYLCGVSSYKVYFREPENLTAYSRMHTNFERIPQSNFYQSQVYRVQIVGVYAKDYSSDELIIYL